jgi:hypothetical protein
MGWGEQIKATPKRPSYVASLQTVVDAARTWKASPTLRNAELVAEALDAHDNEWNPF